jgi:prevent-host-death family protein
MLASPQILPMSDMRNRHTEVLEKLTAGPVFLTRHGVGEAVLLSNEQWASLMEYIEEQADTIDVLNAQLEIARGEDVIEAVDIAALEDLARGDRLST